jgi:hypothetical protein
MSAELDQIIREATVVRPGDTLVIAFDKSISVAQYQEFVRAMDGKLPEGVKAMFVGGAVQLYVLRSGETEAPAPDAGDES